MEVMQLLENLRSGICEAIRSEKKNEMWEKYEVWEKQCTQITCNRNNKYK